MLSGVSARLASSRARVSISRAAAPVTDISRQPAGWICAMEARFGLAAPGSFKRLFYAQERGARGQGAIFISDWRRQLAPSADALQGLVALGRFAQLRTQAHIVGAQQDDGDDRQGVGGVIAEEMPEGPGCAGEGESCCKQMKLIFHRLPCAARAMTFLVLPLYRCGARCKVSRNQGTYQSFCLAINMTSASEVPLFMVRPVATAMLPTTAPA